MRLVTFGLVILWGLSVSSQAVAVEIRSSQDYFFNSSFGDFSEELSNAKEQNKTAIFIMFEMEECPFCKWMKKRVLNRQDVQDYFRQHFMVLEVDIEGDVSMIDFSGKETTQKMFSQKQFRVRATPVFAFIDLNGKIIKRARFTGKTSSVDEFMWLGQFVVDEAYKTMTFTRYKKAKKAALKP